MFFSSHIIQYDNKMKRILFNNSEDYKQNNVYKLFTSILTDNHTEAEKKKMEISVTEIMISFSMVFKYII